MYDYRRMTIEQRLEVVEERRRRGFPLHSPPHPNLGKGWYLITAATYEHKHHFCAANELTALTQRLLEAWQNASVPVAAWVVMLNHYHFLVELERAKDVGLITRPVHRKSAIYANARDEKPGRKVWYKFSDRKIRSEDHFWVCVHYILFNPVKHEFADKPASWPWSCYHDLIEDHGEKWANELELKYPLLDMGKGWDD